MKSKTVERLMNETPEHIKQQVSDYADRVVLVNINERREYIAAMALQGMLANINQSYGKPNVGDIHIQEALRLQQQFINDVATKAVQYSDALIKALREEGGNNE